MSVLVGNVTFYRTLSFVLLLNKDSLKKACRSECRETISLYFQMFFFFKDIILLNLKPKYNSCFYGRILNIRAMFYMAEVLANLKH